MLPEVVTQYIRTLEACIICLDYEQGCWTNALGYPDSNDPIIQPTDEECHPEMLAKHHQAFMEYLARPV